MSDYLDEALVQAEQLYASIPETMTHQRALAFQIQTAIRMARTDTKMPTWIPYLTSSVEMLVVAILAAGYIFRSQRMTGHVTIAQALGYAVDARRVLLDKLDKAEKLFWGNKRFTLDDD